MAESEDRAVAVPPENVLKDLCSLLAEGLVKGLEESKLLQDLLDMVFGLQEKIEKLEGEIKALKRDPAQRGAPAVALPVSSALLSPPRSTGRLTRSRTVSRPTVTYRVDPRTTASTPAPPAPVARSESGPAPANGAEPAADDESKTCTEPGCGRQARSRGLCSLHYQRVRYKERKIEQKQESVAPLPPPPPLARNPVSGQKKNGGTRGVFAVLYEEKGQRILAGLINQMRFDRNDLVERLNSMYGGMPGMPLNEEDVLRAIHYHKLTDNLRKREAEILCRHLGKQRGSLGKTAQRIRMTPEQLVKRIAELGQGAEVEKIRAGFREEILEKSTFNQRLELALTREKYLEDLGIVQEVDQTLRQQLNEQIRLSNQPDPAAACQFIRQALGLDEERFQRLLKRFDLDANLQAIPGEAGTTGSP